MNPSGGLARRAWLIEQVKKALPESPVLLADTGNFSDNPTPAGDAKTRALLEGMTRLGYQVANVGERDLTAGYDALMERVSGLPLKLVSSNLVRQDSKEPVFPPFTVVKVQGKGRKEIKVGVLGVVRFNPVFQKSGPTGTNIVIVPPSEALAKLVPEVRKQADVVVVLAALHKDDARAIAHEVPGIDFVLGAFANMISGTEDEVEGTTHLLYVGNQGKYVGESRVSIAPEGKIASVANYMHMLTARYPDDQATLDWMAGPLHKVQDIEKQAGGAAPAAAGGH